VNVEKFLDDLWVGVKGQSNWEIARTPRNAFRGSLASSVEEVEILIGLGGLTAYQTLPNSECLDMFRGSEGRGAKVPAREGKNPDHRLRPRSPR
jgi:hypothetical protein